jgi:YVTN family beta-propeller protein
MLIAVATLAAATALTAGSARADAGTPVPYTIAVGHGPGHLAVDPSTHLAYITNETSASVSVINTTTNTVVATVPVGLDPFWVAVDATTHAVYVTNAGSGTVSVIDGSTATVTATVTVGVDPAGVTVDPATDTVYVANLDSRSVSVINGTTDTLSATVPVGPQAHPYGIAFNASDGGVYVTHDGQVSVIAGATCNATVTTGCGSPTSTISVGTTTLGVAAIPPGVPGAGSVLVANFDANSVAILQGGAVTRTVSGITDPFGIAIDPSTGVAYVTSYFNPGPLPGTVTAIAGGKVIGKYFGGVNAYGVGIDPTNETLLFSLRPGLFSPGSVAVAHLATGAVSSTVPVGANPYGDTVDLTTGTVYVDDLNSNNVAAVNPATGAVSYIPVGRCPEGDAVDEATQTLYVSNFCDWTVSVIDIASGTVLATLPVGVYPVGVAVDQQTDMIYVANEGGTVSVINGSNNSVSSVNVGAHTVAVAVDEMNDEIIATNKDSNNVSVIDGLTNTVIKTIAVDNQPTGVAIDQATGTAYVGNQVSNDVSVIDGTTGAVTNLPVGIRPLGVAFDQTTGTAIVSDGGGNAMSFIDAATNTVFETVPAGGAPLGAAFDPATGLVYAADYGSNSVTALSTARAPGAPAINSSAAATGAVSVAWSEPTTDGHSSITEYTIAAAPVSGAMASVVTVPAGQLQATIGSLVNGITYSVTVTAVNAAGAGVPSSAVMLTPERTAPAVTLSRSSATVTYGSETADAFTVSITGSGRAPSGPASVVDTATGTTICTVLAGAFTSSGSTSTGTCSTASSTSFPGGDSYGSVVASYQGDANYLPADSSPAQSFTVTPAPLTITASSATINYGTAPPAITPSYSGFVAGEGPSSLSPPPVCSTAATSSSAPGMYATNCSGASDPNYSITDVPGTVTVVALGRLAPQLELLAASGPDLTLSGSSQLKVRGAGILDSGSQTALLLSGSSSVSTVGALETPGGCTPTGRALCPATTPLPGPAPDPFAALPAPSMNGLPVYSDGLDHGCGVYTTSLKISGNQREVLNAGGQADCLYYLEAGFSASGGSVVTTGAGGALLYFAGGGFSCSGNARCGILAIDDPNSPYLGVALYAGHGNSSGIAGSGNSTTTIGGDAYTPDGSVGASGNAALALAGFVAGTISLGGNGSVRVG